MLTGTGKSTDHRKIVTVLDVGTSKVSCFIVELGSAHREHRGFGRELIALLEAEAKRSLIEILSDCGTCLKKSCCNDSHQNIPRDFGPFFM